MLEFGTCELAAKGPDSREDAYDPGGSDLDPLVVTTRSTSEELATANTRRATDAMGFGIVGVPLMFPFGVLLGSAALSPGISALRRLRNGRRTMAGSGRAIAGMVMGSIVCGLCAFALLVEVVVFLLTGALVQAY